MVYFIGKRSCLGKVFALKEIYLMVAALIIKFQFEMNLKDQNTFNIPTDFLIDPKLEVIPIKRENNISEIYKNSLAK